MQDGYSRTPLIISVLLIFPFFFIGGPSYQSPRSFGETWNLGHVLFFALFVILVYSRLLPRYLSACKKTFLCLVIVVLLGWGIEVAQLGLGNRTVGWDDFSRDLAGAGIVFFWRLGNSGKNALRGYLAKMMILVIASACLLPLVTVLVDEYHARRDFPVLSDFESALEMGRWEDSGKLRQVESPVRQGSHSAEIQLTTEQYSGVSLMYFPGDWRGKRALAFSVYNPGLPVDLNYRVHDRLHTGESQQYQNRFNGVTILARGWNDIVIPINALRDGPVSREMDLGHIQGFGLFVMNQPEKRVLYLDDVRLLH